MNMNRKQRRAMKSQGGSTADGDDHLKRLFNQALQFQQAGNLAEAEQIYRQILTADPHHAHSLHMMGLIAFDVKRYDIAEEMIKKAIAQSDRYYQFHLNLGNTFKIQNKFDEAIASYKKTLQLKPDCVDAMNNLAATFDHLKKHEDAEFYFAKATKTDSNYVLGYFNLGVLYVKLEKFEKAISPLMTAIEKSPNHAQATLKLAEAYEGLHDDQKSLPYYQKAAELLPRDGVILGKIGHIYQNFGDLPQALEYYKRTLDLLPNSFEALNNIGIIYFEQGHFDNAINYYRLAMQIDPNNFFLLSNLGGALKSLIKLEEAIYYYKRAIEISSDHAQVYSNLLLTMMYAPFVSPEDLRDAACEFGRRVADPLLRQRPFKNNPDPSRKLRIGYVSPDYRDHPVRFFLEFIIHTHDREKFEVFGYSRTPRADKYTDRFKDAFDHWRDIRHVSDDEAADIVEQDGIDILIDVAGHTGYNSLLVFARKPAPIQISWLGYPATTGMKAMDYRLTDHYTDPPGMTEHLCVEKLWRLPEIFCCYQADAHSPAVIDHSPFEDNDHITFGCFNHSARVGDQVLEAWAKVLEQVPDAKLLWEVEGIQQPKVLEELRERLQRIGMPMDRVILEPRNKANQFVLYNKLDIALDPFPCVGGTTTTDTLWMGVPLITLAGKQFLERLGVTVLSNAGLPELITQSVDEYISCAVALAQDHDRLKKIRHNLRDKVSASPVMDQQRFIHHMEHAYREMWQKWCSEQSTKD